MSIFAQGIIITILKDVCYDHPKKNPNLFLLLIKKNILLKQSKQTLLLLCESEC